MEHSAVRKEVPIKWVYDNVRYNKNEEITFWYEQFDKFLEKNKSRYEIFNFMIKNGTWPFPPVIIEEGFARLLGAEGKIGSPYYLIEGTHRTSYARRMLELGLTATSLIVEVIEIMATNSPHVSRKINGVAGVANSKKLPTP